MPGPGCSALIHDQVARQWRRFRDPLAIVAASATEDIVPALDEVDRHVHDGCVAAGFVCYEAGPAFDAAMVVPGPSPSPLLWFGIFADCDTIEPRWAPREPGPEATWIPSLDAAEYDASIRRIRAYIEAGDTYQVNYTYRLRTLLDRDPWALFSAMIRAQGAHYGAFIDTPEWTLCSASPELFFSLDGNRLASRPMKGTSPRGLWLGQDIAQSNDLQHSAKNRAENVMIVDMVRNDMGRVAQAGSVHVPRLFEIEKYPTLWQMTSTVECLTDARLSEIFACLFPAASITGAPKIRTMEIIAELETAPRGIYCGAAGFVLPGRHVQFSVAIRSVLVDHRSGMAEYGVGGGIVWDSTDRSEYAECATKARVLNHAPPPFSLLETLLWTPSRGLVLLDAHLQRLLDSAAFFDRPAEEQRLRAALETHVAMLPAGPHRIRLQVDEEGTPSVQAVPLMDLPNPYSLGLAPAPVDSRMTMLYHKTTHRGVYERARASVPGVSDVLLWNERGELTESCIANVVLELDGRMVTPPRHCGLLAGIGRNALVAKGTLSEAILTPGDLERATRIHLVNSVRGMWEAQLVRPLTGK